MALRRLITTRNKANAGHGGRGGTTSLHQRNKASRDQTKDLERINSSPELFEAKNETGGATVTRVDGDSGHGGANIIGDGVPMTAVSKTTKQEWIKHHSVKTKL